MPRASHAPPEVMPTSCVPSLRRRAHAFEQLGVQRLRI